MKTRHIDLRKHDTKVGDYVMQCLNKNEGGDGPAMVKRGDQWRVIAFKRKPHRGVLCEHYPDVIRTWIKVLPAK